MQRPDCAHRARGSRKFHHAGRVLVTAASALGLVACLNACSLPGSTSRADAGQPDMSTGARVQGPDGGEPASIDQLVEDLEKLEARLQQLEDIVLLAGPYPSAASGNNYPGPVVRGGSAASAGSLASRPIEPAVIVQPMEGMPAPGKTRVSTAMTPAVQEQPATAQPATAQPATAQPATAQPATAQPATAQLPAPPPPASHAGNWAINLGSYASRKIADRMLEQFHRQDVAAELVTAVVNDRTLYRLRIPGFQTRQTAVAHAESLQQRLGPTDVWIKRM